MNCLHMNLNYFTNNINNKPYVSTLITHKFGKYMIACSYLLIVINKDENIPRFKYNRGEILERKREIERKRERERKEREREKEEMIV